MKSYSVTNKRPGFQIFGSSLRYVSRIVVNNPKNTGALIPANQIVCSLPDTFYFIFNSVSVYGTIRFSFNSCSVPFHSESQNGPNIFEGWVMIQERIRC